MRDNESAYIKLIRMKINNLKRVFVFLVFIVFSYSLSAQLNDMEVTNGATAPYTPENLMTNVFLGEGVEVTEFQYDGSAAAIGFFKNGEEEVGMDRGVIMTTGAAANVNGTIGAGNPGNLQASTAASPNVSIDADLTQLDPNNQNNDISRYIIKFIPTSDTVRFNYVFASEEYPEFSCSSYNDVFGFFISGPGINGPFSDNAENIAIIPGTSDYVSINNLHPTIGECSAVNEQFYNGNPGANYPVYDGFTDVFTAEAIVQPCMEYTLKIVIADKGDTAYDSGVFLQAKSFSSPRLEIEVATVSKDGAIVEGCSEATVEISLASPVAEDFPLDYEIIGTATNGVDYPLIPDDLFIPAGDSTISILIEGFEDGIDEGDETIGIDFQIDVCNRDTFWLGIKDNILIEPELIDNVTQCASDSVQLDATVNIPLPNPPAFTNNDAGVIPTFSALTSSVNVTGVLPNVLEAGVITSICVNIDHGYTDDIDLFLQAPNGQFLELSTDNGGNCDDYMDICFTENATTLISEAGWSVPCSSGESAFAPGNYLPEGDFSDLYGAPTNGEWSLLVVDDGQGYDGGQLLDWSITFEPIYDIKYEWTPTEGLSCSDCPMPFASPDVTTTYTVRAYDSYGCETFDEVQINVMPAYPAPTVICTNVTEECITFSWEDVGAMTYSVNVDNTGWVPANSGLAHTICGLDNSQDVEIEVRADGADCNGFIATTQCTTTSCPVPTIVNQNTTDVTCFGSNDGTLTIEMNGDNPPYTFAINGQTQMGASVVTVTGLSGGTHDLIITDALACDQTIQVVIDEPQAMMVTSVTNNNITCNAANDGNVTLTVQDGTAPYTYLWSNNETTETATMLPAGNNTVTVTDANGCTFEYNVQITEPDALSLTFTSADNNCNGGTQGFIVTTVSGGVPDYTYAWSANANSQTTADISNLAAGDYTLTVTDANMCPIIETVTIAENTPIVTSVTGTPTSCNFSGDGTATVTASGGGVNFFIYQWDSNANDQTTQTATGLDAGMYSVTITDLLNCSVVDDVEIVSPNAVSVTTTEVPTQCFNSADGEVTLNVMGGTAPYSYTWEDGTTTTMPTRSDFLAGDHMVTVTDASGCSDPIPFNIPAPQEIALQVTQNNATSCAGLTDGMLAVSPTGGVGTMTYLWDTNAASQTTATASGLSAGQYCVTVTDANMCSQTICETVSEPAALAESPVSITDVSCSQGANGSVTVNVAGGTMPYQYNWSNAQTTQTASNLAVGNYDVTVTDANNCTIELQYAVAEPTALSVNTTFTPLSCDGVPDGTATAMGSGGTAPYTYSWDNNQTGETATNLGAITYTVTVTDDNGCTATNTVTLTAPIDIVINNITQQDVTCHGGNNGEATVNYSGGTAPFNITWTNNSSTTETATGLSATTYTVVITDLNGCEAEQSVTIVEPEDLVISLAQTPAICHDGIDGTASVANLAYGNTPVDLTTFTYAWNTAPAQSTVQANGLTGGDTYSVLITDMFGCQWTESIEVGNPAAVQATITDATDISCNGGNDGMMEVAGSGGTSPYTYTWDASANNQTTATANNLAVGTYNVTVIDANNCTSTTEGSLTEPEVLDLSLTARGTSCPGLVDGVINASGEGGVAPYIYSWSEGSTGSSQTTLAAGLYTISVTDANGCMYSDTARVVEAEPVTTSIEEVVDVTCFGYRDGAIDLNSVGGTPPYSYSLDGQTFTGSSRLIALEAGNYDITIRDGNDCLYYISDVEVTQPELLTVSLGEDRRIYYGEEIQLVPDVQPTNDGITYNWRSVSGVDLDCYDCSTVMVDTFAGQATFYVSVTNEAGCNAEDYINIFVDKDVNILIPTGFSPNGVNDTQNEHLHVHGDSDIKVDLFVVYDRWGEPVYQAKDFMVNDMTIGWDGKFRGKDMPAGIYVWYIEVKAEDGQPTSFKGNTTLIR